MNGDGQCAQARLELGVYVIGAIEPAQRALVDRHLAACPDCRAELAGLAGLPALLRRVPAAEALQQSPGAAALVPGPSLAALAGRVSRIRRRRWRRTAAAALITGFAAASGLQALHAVAARPPAAAAPRWAVTAEGENPVTGAWLAVRYTTRPWGTSMEVQVTGIAAAAVVIAACGSSGSSGSTPTGAATSGAAASSSALKTATIGGATVVTTARGFTVYWFAPDTPTTSKCNGSCATFWPPVKGPATAGAGVTGKLTTITRSDGSVQAAYNGHPLYTYTGDKAPGQATGNGLNVSGGVWHEVTVSGAAAPAPSQSTSSGGGYGY
jgi:predicted lipoprotein with Yx(FWY)xxD motif